MSAKAISERRLGKKRISFAQDALRTPFVGMLLPFLILFTIFVILVASTKYLSLGSIIGMMLYMGITVLLS